MTEESDRCYFNGVIYKSLEQMERAREEFHLSEATQKAMSLIWKDVGDTLIFNILKVWCGPTITNGEFKIFCINELEELFCKLRRLQEGKEQRKNGV